MNTDIKVNSSSEFLLISQGEPKRVSYTELVEYFDSGFDAYNSSSSGTKGIKGQKGEKGDIGAKGLKGYRGITGQEGLYGSFGEDGQKGEKGDVGDIGNKGIKGSKGSAGENGEKGLRGDFGDTGDDGHKGSKGQIGEFGDKGDKGFVGTLIKGIKGRKGVKGFGRQGDSGEKGQKGEFGETGDIGEKGYTGHTNNVITKSTDLSGSWNLDKSDILEINIADEFSTEYSRTLIKVRRGRYYDRFVLRHTSFCEIGTQLNDPLRNCYTSFNHLIYDTVNDVEIPMLIVTEQTNKIDHSNGDNTLITEDFIVCKIFYDGTSKKIPFSTYVTDKF